MRKRIRKWMDKWMPTSETAFFLTCVIVGTVLVIIAILVTLFTQR